MISKKIKCAHNYFIFHFETIARKWGTCSCFVAFKLNPKKCFLEELYFSKVSRYENLIYFADRSYINVSSHINQLFRNAFEDYCLFLQIHRHIRGFNCILRSDAMLSINIHMNSNILKLNKRIYYDNLVMYTNGLPCGLLFASPLNWTLSCGVTFNATYQNIRNQLYLFMVIYSIT